MAGTADHYLPITTQTITISGTSAATSNAFGTGIFVVRLVSDTDCHFAIAAAPTATTSSPFLPADTVEYISVRPGQKLALIQNASGGVGYVTEMSK